MTQVIAAAGAGISLLAGFTYYFRKKSNRRREEKNDLTLHRNLERLIDQDQYEYYLIDVRSENEYRKGHIPTAVNVPYGELGSFLPTDKLFCNIVVYGRSPLQSNRASAILEETGYFNVTSFGPFFRWRGKVARPESKSRESAVKSS